MRPIPETSTPDPAAPDASRLKALGRRLLREPLLHFLVAGGLLYAGAGVLKANERPEVRIDAQELNQLATYWQAQMQRAPTKAEMQGIIRERIDEEILAREALRLGLDRNDMIVRRRLAQKMAFASEDTSAVKEPDDATLRAWFDQHQDRYLEPAHLSFRQLYFAADRSRSEAQITARTALDRLRKGDSNVRGEAFLLPLTYGDVTTVDLARDYGQAFVDALVKAPVGTWTGPLSSSFGEHLVRVEARDPPVARPYADVKADVRDAWLQAQRKAGNTQFLEKLRARYRVVVDGLDEK